MSSRKGRVRSYGPIKYWIVCVGYDARDGHVPCGKLVRATSTVQKRCPDCRYKHERSTYRYHQTKQLIGSKRCWCGELLSPFAKRCPEHKHERRRQERLEHFYRHHTRNLQRARKTKREMRGDPQRHERMKQTQRDNHHLRQLLQDPEAFAESIRQLKLAELSELLFGPAQESET